MSHPLSVVTISTGGGGSGGGHIGRVSSPDTVFVDPDDTTGGDVATSSGVFERVREAHFT